MSKAEAAKKILAYIKKREAGSNARRKAKKTDGVTRVVGEFPERGSPLRVAKRGFRGMR